MCSCVYKKHLSVFLIDFMIAIERALTNFTIAHFCGQTQKINILIILAPLHLFVEFTKSPGTQKACRVKVSSVIMIGQEHFKHFDKNTYVISMALLNPNGHVGEFTPGGQLYSGKSQEIALLYLRPFRLPAEFG